MCSCISPMASLIFSFQACPQIIVQQCWIAASKWSNDIRSVIDNAILKTRAQNIECSFGCAAPSAVLLKSNLANIFLFNFYELKLVQQGPLMIAIDCNGHSLFIFEEEWPKYASGSKSARNSDESFGCVVFSMYACGFSVIQIRKFCSFTYLSRSI